MEKNYRIFWIVDRRRICDVDNARKHRKALNINYYYIYNNNLNTILTAYEVDLSKSTPLNN